MIPFNYHHLYYFYIIAQKGSITAATKELRLAQPTLSAQLKEFEQFLGVELFIRENRKLILTEEGHKILSYATMIFDIGQELKDRMVDLTNKGRPQIRIGISNFIPMTIVDIFLKFILKHFPDAYVHLEKNSMDQLNHHLNDHLLDIILTDTPFETPVDNNFQHKFIGKIPFVFCAHPSLAKTIKRFPKDLNKHRLILPAAPQQIGYLLKEFLYEHHIEPTILGEIQDSETVRRLALGGYGVAALNALSVKEGPSAEKLVILNERSKHQIYETVYLIVKKRKQPTPIVEHIMEKFMFKYKP